MDFSSLSLSTSALHGTCFATKTTTHGQPFAVTLAGITGRNLSSCWTLHWLAALHSLVTPHLQQEEAPDFLWLSTALDAQALDELAPASYCTALLCLRYVATLPWRAAGSGLLPGEARQLTLHSMKSTLLAAAAQLRLAKEIRLAQGHHRDSARLYSRNDTFDSLDAQHRLATAMSTGWRPNRSVARGGQAPIPEPPFSLPPGEPLSSIAPQDILSGPWNYFASRHEALHAASCTLSRAPTGGACRCWGSGCTRAQSSPGIAQGSSTRGERSSRTRTARRGCRLRASCKPPGRGVASRRKSGWGNLSHVFESTALCVIGSGTFTLASISSRSRGGMEYSWPRFWPIRSLLPMRCAVSAWRPLLKASQRLALQHTGRVGHQDRLFQMRVAFR